MTELEIARQIINKTDKEMAALFEKRMDAARLVANYKKEHGLQVDDLAREEELIARNCTFIKDDDYKSYYVNYLRETINISKTFQHRILDGMRVAYSGVKGAFANIVAKRIFPDANCVGYKDFKSAYNAVVAGDCDCALLPIENSFNGDVGKVMDLSFFGSLFVNGVYEADIIQNLLAVKGAKLSDIKKVISHPQALGQCSPYIEKHGFETEEAVNTAVAAKRVAEQKDIHTAAIGSEEAAEEFGLVKLEAHINESNTNSTRFAVFSRSEKLYTENDNHFIMLFTVKNAAGSLGRAMSVIGEHGFNLRAIKSRPTKELVWDYYFYAEGEGNLKSENGVKMLEELSEFCSNLKVLGHYDKEIKV